MTESTTKMQKNFSALVISCVEDTKWHPKLLFIDRVKYLMATLITTQRYYYVFTFLALEERPNLFLPWLTYGKPVFQVNYRTF